MALNKVSTFGNHAGNFKTQDGQVFDMTLRDWSSKGHLLPANFKDIRHWLSLQTELVDEAERIVKEERHGR